MEPSITWTEERITHRNKEQQNCWCHKWVCLDITSWEAEPVIIAPNLSKEEHELAKNPYLEVPFTTCIHHTYYDFDIETECWCLMSHIQQFEIFFLHQVVVNQEVNIFIFPWSMEPLESRWIWYNKWWIPTGDFVPSLKRPQRVCFFFLKNGWLEVFFVGGDAVVSGVKVSLREGIYM